MLYTQGMASRASRRSRGRHADAAGAAAVRADVSMPPPHQWQGMAASEYYGSMAVGSIVGASRPGGGIMPNGSGDVAPAWAARSNTRSGSSRQAPGRNARNGGSQGPRPEQFCRATMVPQLEGLAVVTECCITNVPGTLPPPGALNIGAKRSVWLVLSANALTLYDSASRCTRLATLPLRQLCSVERMVAPAAGVAPYCVAAGFFSPLAETIRRPPLSAIRTLEHRLGVASLFFATVEVQAKWLAALEAAADPRPPNAQMKPSVGAALPAPPPPSQAPVGAMAAKPPPTGLLQPRRGLPYGFPGPAAAVGVGAARQASSAVSPYPAIDPSLVPAAAMLRRPDARLCIPAPSAADQAMPSSLATAVPPNAAAAALLDVLPSVGLGPPMHQAHAPRFAPGPAQLTAALPPAALLHPGPVPPPIGMMAVAGRFGVSRELLPTGPPLHDSFGPTASPGAVQSVARVPGIPLVTPATHIAPVASLPAVASIPAGVPIAPLIPGALGTSVDRLPCVASILPTANAWGIVPPVVPGFAEDEGVGLHDDEDEALVAAAAAVAVEAAAAVVID